MLASDLKYFVTNALEFECDNADDCPYSDKEFLLHLNMTLQGLTLDMLNKDLTSFVNLKKEITDIEVTDVPGTRGYQGMYKLPDDLLQIKDIKISLDGTCWVDGHFTSQLDFDYECNNCPCVDPQCGIDLTKINNYVQVRPIPEVYVRNGYVLYYEALPNKVEKLGDKLQFSEIDQQYLGLLVVDYYMAVHADKYSTTKVQRLFNKFNRSKQRFDKLHDMQTRHRVQKQHTKPYM